MKIRFIYKTYQDVRNNTFLYFLPVMYLLSLSFYLFIFPTSWKIEIDIFIGELITDNPGLKFWIKGISIFIIYGCISYFLIEILKIHDHFYDRYIIRWRKYFDRDFILPRLCTPFLNASNTARFFEEINAHNSIFMEKLYYVFVGDEIEKIHINTRTRFYEVITIYWLTQMNEFAFILSFLIINILAIVKPDNELLITVPFFSLALLFLLFLNWLWKKSNNIKVENATIAQISEIHNNPDLLLELKTNFKQLCTNYNIPFDE
ncbi:MAG: hypothetical protein WC446_04495 [Candidatus Paceibacterota bacterium]|jgi:hypothetical protein